ncbi:MAG: cysteine--tRNA ligase [Candidatus Andersenbacteria bacterium]|nr:cysteine--tRNA ligase [Candidatus Andersenbacteria bacterium]
MPSMRLYNSLSRSVEDFSPLDDGKVRMYNCGPTVYKRQHIGNMRRFLFADFLRRSLELWGYEVRDITNITDVGHLTQDEIEAGEDKMEKAAREEKTTPQKIAAQQIALFEEDLKALNITPAHMYPRASAHIPHMQKLIEKLIERGHAYVTASGVYFDVATFPAYGRLSGNTLQALKAGARVEVRGDKRNPADFALWVKNETQLQTWDSPWGKGYPGWHIECSAMALEYLGSNIDIHTGGEDNTFPHHENEIAQSEGVTGETFVRVWMHNRHLQISGKKMAKREGEVITLDTLKEKGFSPLSLRLFMFAAHYRTLTDFSWEGLQEFQGHLESLRQLMRRIKESETEKGGVISGSSPVRQLAEGRLGGVADFAGALADDLNTPQAWAVFLETVKKLNAALDAGNIAQATSLYATLQKMDSVVGVLSPLLHELEGETIPEEIKELATQRDQYKKAKDFVKADALRVDVEMRGYKIEDTPHGPRIVKTSA